ncbi:hypothetical protein BU14_0070s0065 [Porphyra umbilicalis]|uniref:Uncharacterized protein n=1 Tax=Porphyra umbilicalis TaxID=2786 RepID=A0A1X6PGA8_PORUM|nr:hypothetical protein BU14_0070s0065 [Porphyra umbilicalis]|eukprot:OSX79889.1 hypothetical protein BU14_0070s0065 [Porphyra umbilicalis]
MCPTWASPWRWLYRSRLRHLRRRRRWRRPLLPQQLPALVHDRRPRRTPPLHHLVVVHPRQQKRVYPAPNRRHVPVDVPRRHVHVVRPRHEQRPGRVVAPPRPPRHGAGRGHHRRPPRSPAAGAEVPLRLITPVAEAVGGGGIQVGDRRQADGQRRHAEATRHVGGGRQHERTPRRVAKPQRVRHAGEERRRQQRHRRGRVFGGAGGDAAGIVPAPILNLHGGESSSSQGSR